jgi:DNA-binding MarR family transcriptional regulator
MSHEPQAPDHDCERDWEHDLDLGILLALGYQEFVRQLHEALAAAGFDDLGRSDGYVFRALAEAPLSTSALAARLDITKQGAAQIVEDMTGRGYLERRPDPADGRARLLFLSSRGQAALAEARRFHHVYEASLSKRHGRAAVTSLRDLLTSMARGRGSNGAPDPRLRAMYL